MLKNDQPYWHRWHDHAKDIPGGCVMCQEVELARKYISKAQSAKARGVEFNLSFTSFKNLMRAKRCRYTGLPLNNKNRTIDRIDSKRGYISGNVAAVHDAANQIKSAWENPQNPLTAELVKKICESSP